MVQCRDADAHVLLYRLGFFVSDEVDLADDGKLRLELFGGSETGVSQLADTCKLRFVMLQPMRQSDLRR